MEKAQAKLKSAKESMERKRGGVQNHLKSGSKNDRKDKEEMLTKIVNGSVSRNDEREQGISQIEENGKEFSILEEKKKVKRTTQPISDSLEGKKHLDVAKKTAEENHGRESSSSQVSERIDGASEWKEATQFFELVTNKSRKAFDQENTENDLLHNSNFHERAKKGKGETVEALQQLERNHKKVKAVRADDEPVDRRSSGRSEVVNRQKGIDKKLQVAREASRQEGDEKKFHMDWKPVETEKRQAGADDFQKHENYVEVQQKESKIAARQTMKHREKGLRLKEDSRKNDRRLKKAVHKQEENENILREAYEREENERRLREALRREENERRLKEALEKKENERILKETGEKEERLRRQREAVERQENENRLREVRERKENEKRQREAREREENEKRQRDAREREENEKRQRDAVKEKKMKRERERLVKEKKMRRDRERLV
ncbi:hypothetical protein GH714_034102 [Hevea brasiliensis]|uniref:Uncharacterized protein n=1 Tax=Hevea brasiliensis TaxID=3981 RepID=A0A6A6LLK2_HEVBR|nr:hypothetical protein GH714_034102 [Hevea brasiliensis]